MKSHPLRPTAYSVVSLAIALAWSLASPLARQQAHAQKLQRKLLEHSFFDDRLSIQLPATFRPVLDVEREEQYGQDAPSLVYADALREAHIALSMRPVMVPRDSLGAYMEALRQQLEAQDTTTEWLDVGITVDQGEPLGWLERRIPSSKRGAGSYQLLVVAVSGNELLLVSMHCPDPARFLWRGTYRRVRQSIWVGG